MILGTTRALRCSRSRQRSIERVGLSDASKLHDIHGWTSEEIVDNYVTVGACCLAVLLAVWAYATWRSRRQALETA